MYTIHSFLGDVNLVGHIRDDPDDPYARLLPSAHGRTITLQNHTPTVPSPPPGIISWHYLQCVLKLFGSSQLREEPNIVYHELPFKTEDDDDDDEFDWDYYDQPGVPPPYPSYHWGPRYVKAPPAVSKDDIMKWANSVNVSVGRMFPLYVEQQTDVLRTGKSRWIVIGVCRCYQNSIEYARCGRPFSILSFPRHLQLDRQPWFSFRRIYVCPHVAPFSFLSLHSLTGASIVFHCHYCTHQANERFSSRGVNLDPFSPPLDSAL